MRWRAGRFVALVAVLAAVASMASRERLPDSYWYERAADQTIVPGCAEIHCFRVLVPWALSVVPAPSLVKWKGYAAVCNAAAALAVFDLCLTFGLSRRAATIALALSAFGFGSLYTLFEPFTSDPLMFMLGPLLTRWLLEERLGRAALVTCLGVFAKEFVVAPLVIVGLAAAADRRWPVAARAVAAAAVAFAIWLGLHLSLMRWLHYTYGPNRSPDLLSGSYLWVWWSHLTLREALSAQFNEFGAVYLLMPVGWLSAPRPLRRLTLAALPVACVLGYVQQPDRALWNFHFLAMPLAAIVLEPLPGVMVWTFVALYGAADLRVGAQVFVVPQARYALAASVVLALAAIVVARRASTPSIRAVAT